MKRSIVCFVLLILVHNCFAQEQADESHGFLGVSLGAMIPLGSYAKDQSSNDGYSTGGYNLQFDFLVKGNGRAGIAGKVGYFRNGLKSSIANNDSISDYDFSSDKRNNMFFMVGPSYTIPAKGIQIDLKASFGFVHISDYSYRITYNATSSYSYYDRSYYTDEGSQSGSWKPGYSIGANFRMDIGSRLQAIVGIDYMGTSYKQYSSSTLNYKSTWNTDKQTFNYENITLSTLSINWGLVVKY